MILCASLFLISGISAPKMINFASTPLVITNIGKEAKYVAKTDDKKVTQIKEETQNFINVPVANIEKKQEQSQEVVTQTNDNSDQQKQIGALQGNAGRLSLPSVGFEMPLYNGDASSWANIVDAESSALYTNYLGKMMIADHAHQGFSAMKNSQIGSIGYIINGNNITTIRCKSMYQGINTGYGVTINGIYADEMTDGSLFMYTCNDETGISVTVTFWEYV